MFNVFSLSEFYSLKKEKQNKIKGSVNFNQIISALI